MPDTPTTEHHRVAALLKKAGLKPPETLSLAITARCNLSCPHCWVDAGHHPEQLDVPPQLLQRIITDHRLLGGSGLRLTGGEPLCHPHCLELVAQGAALGFARIILQTNGLLLSDRLLQELERTGGNALQLEISMDGATAATHDAVRGSGSFAATLKLLARLHATGLARRTTLLFTEMKHNLHEYPLILELAARHDVAAVTGGTLIRGGRAAASGAVSPPETDQYEQLAWLYLHDQSFMAAYDRLGTMAALEWLKQPDDRNDCRCLLAADPYLAADGRLYPCRICHSRRYSVSQVHRKGLLAALAAAIPKWLLLQQTASGRAAACRNCRNCSERKYCAAGCLGRAHACTGSLTAKDDRCQTRKRMAKLGRHPLTAAPDQPKMA